MKAPALAPEDPHFSPVLGGSPLDAFRGERLSRDGQELVTRRILVFACVAWLPLLVLSAFSGSAIGDAAGIPFLHDIEVHVRFLIAVPILIGAERYVYPRLRSILEQFLRRGIIVPDDRPRFQEAIASAARVRDSKIANVALFVLVYSVGLLVWRAQVATGPASWFMIPDGADMRLTTAGYWCVFISLPLFQFILLRWYLRFLIWCWVLWRVSKLDLFLVPTHADRTAGLGFMDQSTRAFLPILLAQAAVLSGVIAGRVLLAGHDLMEFKLQAVGFLVFFVGATLSPLLVFASQLALAKRRGLNEFGGLASRYAGAFQEKWLRGGASDDELLGSGDIQSLTDIAGSYAIVQEMRTVPFGLRDAVRLAIASAVPLLPLLLTVFSAEELVTEIIKVLF